MSKKWFLAVLKPIRSVTEYKSGEYQEDHFEKNNSFTLLFCLVTTALISILFVYRLFIGINIFYNYMHIQSYFSV